MNNPTIQKAKTSNAHAISRLILDVADYFMVQPDGNGAERFLASMSVDSIARYLQNPEYDYYVCSVNDELAGVVAARGRNHLFHLFVAEKFQKQGIASLLWKRLKTDVFDSNGVAQVSVNSTPYAVPVYEKFGFNVVGDKVEKDGIAFVPMLFVVHSFNKSSHSPH